MYEGGHLQEVIASVSQEEDDWDLALLPSHPDAHAQLVWGRTLLMGVFDALRPKLERKEEATRWRLGYMLEDATAAMVVAQEMEADPPPTCVDAELAVVTSCLNALKAAMVQTATTLEETLALRKSSLEREFETIFGVEGLSTAAGRQGTLSFCLDVLRSLADSFNPSNYSCSDPRRTSCRDSRIDRGTRRSKRP